MKKTILTNCTLLDGSEGMKPRENMTVILDGEIIESVQETCPALEDVHLFNLQGHYLRPGLVNLQACLSEDGRPRRTPGRAEQKAGFMMGNPLTRARLRLKSGDNARVAMMSGVTTMVAVGSAGAMDSLVRDWINIAHVEGPRILATNTTILPRGGEDAGTQAPEEARAQVRSLGEGKPDLMRIVAARDGARMSPQCLRACCEEAHALGCRTMVWADDLQAVRTALENGADIIEHGARLDQETAGLFLEKGAALVCTLSPLAPWALPGGRTEVPGAREELEELTACAREALAVGIPVGLGSGAGAPCAAHYDMWRELYWFHKLVGADSAQTLSAATRVGAAIAGLGDLTGTIEAGKCADFFVTDRSPLEDLTALRDPTMVVVRGIVMTPRQFKNKSAEKALDRLL